MNVGKKYFKESLVTDIKYYLNYLIPLKDEISAPTPLFIKLEKYTASAILKWVNYILKELRNL